MLPWPGRNRAARVDARVTFRPRGPTGRWTLYLEVINLLDRENAGWMSYELQQGLGDRPRMVPRRDFSIPFLPSLGIRYRF